jgi:hypothetical protein
MVSLSNGNNTSIGSSGIAYFFIWDNESPDNCAGNNKTIVNRYVPAGHSLKCEDANSIDISDSYVGSSGDMVLSAANGITIREPFHAHYGSTFRASSAPQSVGRDQNGTVSKFNTDLPKNPLRAPLSQKLSESNNVEKQKIESLYDASGLLLSSVADLIFSREGDVIIFSTEDSIHPLDNNTSRDIYLYNTSTGNLTYVSAGLIHPQENGAECSSPFLEDGGQFVVFQLSKEYGRDIDLFMYDLANSVLTRVASLSDQPEDSDPASAPVIDSSATNIAYVKYNHIGDRSIVKHMRLHDGKWVEMARNQKDVGSRESCPTLSRDGRYLAYFEQSNPEEETAQNLVVIDLLNSLYAKQKFTTNDFSPKESRGRFIGNSLYMEWDLVGESSQQRVEFFAPLPSIPLDYHLMEATN